MSDYELTMSLAIRHPDIDPDRITRALGLQPGYVWKKGENRRDEAGSSLGTLHNASYWLCEIAPRHRFSGERVGLESELSRVLQMLSAASGFLQSLHAEGGATELHVTLFSRGDVRLDLPPNCTALLGRLAVAMRIDIKPYPSGTAAGS
jgi:hypothetical protein